jgi:hypothetical protein
VSLKHYSLLILSGCNSIFVASFQGNLVKQHGDRLQSDG